ncbi:unnamed protein product, partial [Amoebophrya sp. A120]|eukprot:GSA120T00013226001.1
MIMRPHVPASVRMSRRWKKRCPRTVVSAHKKVKNPPAEVVVQRPLLKNKKRPEQEFLPFFPRRSWFRSCLQIFVISGSTFFLLFLGLFSCEKDHDDHEQHHKSSSCSSQQHWQHDERQTIKSKRLRTAQQQELCHLRDLAGAVPQPANFQHLLHPGASFSTIFVAAAALEGTTSGR